MDLDHNFVQVSKLSEYLQKKVFTKNGTLFSPNSGEDQKKKRSSLTMKHFFPQIQVNTYAQMHTRQCRRYGGLNGCLCPPPHFDLLKVLYLEHHITTRQQAMIVKVIITFNIILLWRFLQFLWNSWQPNAVCKSDPIIHLINLPLRMCRER